MDDFLLLRCQNEKAHSPKGERKAGNIVAFIGKNSVTVRCIDSYCKHWNKISFSLPGINVDLRKAGISQTVIKPGSVTFKAGRASAIVDN